MDFGQHRWASSPMLTRRQSPGGSSEPPQHCKSISSSLKIQSPSFFILNMSSFISKIKEASRRTSESAELLYRTFARLGACFRTWNWHRHGRQDEYFSIRIVQFDARFSLPRLCSSSFRPRYCFGKTGHCILTAASVQRIIRHKHRSGRQHIPHHHRLHRKSRQTVID